MDVSLQNPCCKQYFSKLLNEERPHINWETGEATFIDINSFTTAEVEQQMKRMKFGKATGPDQIPIEALQSLGVVGLEMVTHLLNSMLSTGMIPDIWRHSILVPIYKGKGDHRDCSNYRGIKLLSHSMKLLERLLDSRLRQLTNESANQFGFRQGRSTIDPAFALLLYLQDKHEDGKDQHNAFVDLEKAYDTVPRDYIQRVLWCRHVPEQYVALINNMYKESRTKMQTKHGQTEDFLVSVGVHQGSALSPYLFILCIDEMTHHLIHSKPENNLELLFANDFMLTANSSQVLQNRLEIWRDVMESHGLKFSRRKTEFMSLVENENLQLQGIQLNKVDCFKYLGVTMSVTGNTEQDI